MGKNQDKNEIFDEENGLQLVNLFKEFKRRRITIIVIMLLFFLLGMIYAFSKPNLYESGVTFLPQSVSSPKIGRNLGGLAALAGLKLNSSGQSGALSPIVYPKVFESINYRLLLSKSPVSLENGKVQSLESYFIKNKKKPSFLGGFINMLKPKSKSSKDVDNISFIDSTQVINLTKTQRFILGQIKRATDISIHEDEGYIRLSSTTENSILSAQIAANASKLLQELIIDIQINKAKEELKYLKKRLFEQQETFQEAQLKLANYKDRNQFASTQRTTTVLNKLQSHHDLAFGIYLDLAQQVESQQLQVKKDTPIFTTIELASISENKVGPNRLFIIGLFMISSIFAVLFLVIGKQYIRYLLTII